MKTKLLIAVCVLVTIFGSAGSAAATESGGPMEMVADIVVVRPACFVATALGSAFFVISLPIAALSKSVKKTADTLVVKPAKATFTRPIGDMQSLVD